jgi:hypothetical protein
MARGGSSLLPHHYPIALCPSLLRTNPTGRPALPAKHSLRYFLAPTGNIEHVGTFQKELQHRKYENSLILLHEGETIRLDP